MRNRNKLAVGVSIMAVSVGAAAVVDSAGHKNRYDGKKEAELQQAIEPRMTQIATNIIRLAEKYPKRAQLRTQEGATHLIFSASCKDLIGMKRFGTLELVSKDTVDGLPTAESALAVGVVSHIETPDPYASDNGMRITSTGLFAPGGGDTPLTVLRNDHNDGWAAATVDILGSTPDATIVQDSSQDTVYSYGFNYNPSDAATSARMAVANAWRDSGLAEHRWVSCNKIP
jgi:hypothetical protein